MNEVASTIVIALGTGLAGSFGGWIFGRKRQNIENIDMALETWQKVVDSLEKRVDTLLTKVDALSKENDELKDEIAKLREEIALSAKRNKKNEQLEKTIAKYEKLLTDNGIHF